LLFRSRNQLIKNLIDRSLDVMVTHAYGRSSRLNIHRQ
jgi:hypothetical protein